MQQKNFRINDKGEISREDYLFLSAKEDNSQPLPTNRKVWKIILLGILTFGIYNIVITFAAAKETNITCAEDGKTTRGFWGAVGLSIVTLGLYAYIWWWKWIDREYNFLEKNSTDGGIITGARYFIITLMIVLLQLASNFLPAFISPQYNPDTYLSYFGCIVSLVVTLSIILATKWIKQHNAVNKIYNLKSFGKFLRK